MTELFLEILPETIQVRFSTYYMEVYTGEFEPHLSRDSHKLLIINNFIISHWEVGFLYSKGTQTKSNGYKLRLRYLHPVFRLFPLKYMISTRSGHGIFATDASFISTNRMLFPKSLFSIF